MDKLKGKTILIGKEQGQGRLLVAIVGGKAEVIGAVGSVPASVSRCKASEGIAHAKIVVSPTGNMLLTNLKEQNVTYVNGAEIASKHIVNTDCIELGKDHYILNLPLVLKTAEKMVDQADKEAWQRAAQVNENAESRVFNISHLKGVWETYESEIDAIAMQQRNVARNRMLPIMIGSLSGVASPILATLVEVSTLYITVPIAAISFTLYFINYRRKDTSYEDRKNATEKFTDEYVCPNPHCNKFLGTISYKRIQKQYSMKCPYCKCEYVEK